MNTEEVICLLEGYEDFEAMLIKDNSLWWPYAAQDVIRGDMYDKMLELQALRNELLSKLKLKGNE